MSLSCPPNTEPFSSYQAVRSEVLAYTPFRDRVCLDPSYFPFTPVSCVRWNDLPSVVHSSDSLGTHKKHLKTQLCKIPSA